MATYLIIYRVADGTAWTKRTMVTVTMTLPTLQFIGQSGAAGTTHRDGETVIEPHACPLAVNAEAGDNDASEANTVEAARRTKEA